MVLAAVPLTATSAATGSSDGLWSSSFSATATDCSIGARDSGNFCYIDDGGAVELGVKFTTSRPVFITGVRVYRVDGGSVTGSLWAADGSLLATGSFGAQSGHGWQDLAFTSPVRVAPGQTYIASYFAPGAEYAYEYEYFTNSALTAGPITALQSVEGDRNGVFCYAGQTCGSLPTNSFRDTNYWVTPLWVSYDFDGFSQPVDSDTWNTAKAGRAIPVKFSLGGDFGLDILKTGYPKATLAACNATAGADAVEETVADSKSGLSYDATTDQYVYVWKTNKNWAGKCFTFDLGLDDGSSHTFKVGFTR
jgi:hypothetical protein